MLLSTVNFSHSISRFGSCRLSLHAQNTVKSWIPLFTWLSPRQCSALFSCPIKCNLSLVCLFFSLYYLVPLYLSFLVLLDLICGSHFCLISSLTLFYSLTQVCPFLKNYFLLFSEIILSTFQVISFGFWPGILPGQYLGFIGIINHIGYWHEGRADDTRLPMWGSK